jgi:hypothetical protein
MPVVPTTAYSQAEDALTLARALMNDSSGAVFTDALLMPLLNSAYRGLQRELAENGVSVLGEQQDIDLEPDPASGGGMLNLQPSTYLRLWEWREDKINLVGATQAITVRVRYEKILPALTLGTDPVQIRAATDPLAFATAALAARSRGARALAQDLLGTAQMATEDLIQRYVRPEQVKGRRRKPYSYHRRVIYL